MRFLKFFLVFVCFILPLLCQPINAETKKAKSIDELAARYDCSSCKECHEEIYEQWEKSLHSKSLYGTGRTAATIVTAVTKGLMTWPYSGVKKGRYVLPSGVVLPFDLKTIKVKHLWLCAKCHLPQLSDATDEVAQEIVAAAFNFRSRNRQVRKKAFKQLRKLNINCLICHWRNASIFKWKDGFPQKGVLYGPTYIEEHACEAYPKVEKSPIINESIFCIQCHGIGPNLELEEPSQCATLVGSYVFNYVSNGGSETCQDCHMKRYGKGHIMPAYRDVDMGKAAVDLNVHTATYPSHLLAFVEVQLTNKTGHEIPDG